MTEASAVEGAQCNGAGLELAGARLTISHPSLVSTVADKKLPYDPGDGQVRYGRNTLNIEPRTDASIQARVAF